MSVVPLVPDGAHPTIVDTVPAFEGAGGVNSAVVLIRSLERRQLAGDASNVSYDLRVGIGGRTTASRSPRLARPKRSGPYRGCAGLERFAIAQAHFLLTSVVVEGFNARGEHRSN